MKDGNNVMDFIMESVLGHTPFGDPQTEIEVERVSARVGKIQSGSIENQTISTQQGSVNMENLALLESSEDPTVCMEQKVKL